jgi:hypothetical protein
MWLKPDRLAVSRSAPQSLQISNDLCALWIPRNTMYSTPYTPLVCPYFIIFSLFTYQTAQQACKHSMR